MKTGSGFRAQLHGCERSGTNLTQVLIRKHLPLVRLYNGRKHEPYDGKRQNLIVVSKHPLAWMDSMYRFQQIRHWMPYMDKKKATFDYCTPFGAFIILADLPGHWSRMYRHWLTPRDGVDLVHVRYEDFLKNPKRALSSISTGLGGEPVEGEVALPARKLDEKQTETDKPFDPDYYLDQKWRKKYSPDLLRMASAGLDIPLMQGMGYENLSRWV